MGDSDAPSRLDDVLLQAPPLTAVEQSIVDSFEHHTPSSEQTERIQWLRHRYKALAAIMCRIVPASADRTAALRLLHESMMTANKAIALETPAAERR